jgi:hypothetical protein
LNCSCKKPEKEWYVKGKPIKEKKGPPCGKALFDAILVGTARFELATP